MILCTGTRNYDKARITLNYLLTQNCKYNFKEIKDKFNNSGYRFDIEINNANDYKSFSKFFLTRKMQCLFFENVDLSDLLKRDLKNKKVTNNE